MLGVQSDGAGEMHESTGVGQGGKSIWLLHPAGFWGRRAQGWGYPSGYVPPNQPSLPLRKRRKRWGNRRAAVAGGGLRWHLEPCEGDGGWAGGF